MEGGVVSPRIEGTGAEGTRLFPLRRGLQHLHRVQTSGRAGACLHTALCAHPAEVEGQPGKDCGGAALEAHVPGLQDDSSLPTETAGCHGVGKTAKGETAHDPASKTGEEPQSNYSGHRTAVSGMDGLLPLGAAVGIQWQRPLVERRHLPYEPGRANPIPVKTWSRKPPPGTPKSGWLVLNRRIRTRAYGGVGGKGPKGPFLHDQIACAYEDANDRDLLREDPAFKAACARLPASGADLASQPTMSRLENGIRRSDLVRIGKALVEGFIASYDTPPDAVHGNQHLSLFNGYHDQRTTVPCTFMKARQAGWSRRSCVRVRVLPANRLSAFSSDW